MAFIRYKPPQPTIPKDCLSHRLPKPWFLSWTLYWKAKPLPLTFTASKASSGRNTRLPTKRTRLSRIPTSDIVAESLVVDGFTISQTNYAGIHSSQERSYASTGIILKRTDARKNITTTESDLAGRSIKVNRSQRATPPPPSIFLAVMRQPVSRMLWEAPPAIPTISAAGKQLNTALPFSLLASLMMRVIT